MNPSYLHTVYPVSNISVYAINDTDKENCKVELWKKTGEKRKPYGFACSVFVGSLSDCLKYIGAMTNAK